MLKWERFQALNEAQVEVPKFNKLLCILELDDSLLM